MIILPDSRTPNGSKPPRRRAESLLLVAAGIAMGLSLLFPIWRISLDAPQYPEGLGMYIHAHTIAGMTPHDLDNINELNHYIGMKKIIPAAIPELHFIPALILAFAAASLLAALRPRIWSTGLLLASLTAAGASGLYDFWRWEYDYGHDLNPMAAIRLPGMTYQPPLIGQAHLLNFISTSWPAMGGYLLFAAGMLIAAALGLSLARRRMPHWARSGSRAARGASVTALLGLLLSACGPRGPVPIAWGEDACHFCRMTLADKGFAAERINAKGKVYKFDSIECLLSDLRDRPLQAGERLYVSDRSRPDAPMIEAAAALYLQGGALASPMGKALAAFTTADSASAWQARIGGEQIAWNRLSAR